jgi:predicted Zn-dependent protease
LIKLTKQLNELLLKISPSSNIAALTQIQLFYHQKQFEQALQDSRTALQQGSDPMLYLLQAKCYFQMEDYTNSLKSLDDALASDFKIRESIEYLILRSRVMVRLQNQSNAKELVDSCKKKITSDSEPYWTFNFLTAVMDLCLANGDHVI